MEDYLVKASLMGESPDLYQLNKGLVDTGMMSDTEFWRIRQDQLQFQKSRLETRKDYKFSIPWSFAVTNNLKDQIFEKFPQVKKVFDGRRVIEEEFWNEFFRSQAYGDGSEPSKLFDKKGSLVSRLDSTKSAKSLEPISDAQYVISRLVDLTANEADHHFEGYGNQEREYFEDEVKLRTTLLQEISESSARLLPSQSSVRLPTKRTNNNNDVKQSIILQDLTEDLYFKDQEIEPASKTEKKPVAEGPISTPLVIDPNYNFPATPPAQLVGLDPIASSMLKIEEEEVAEKLPEFVSIKYSDVQDIHRRFMEILKHFWTVIPPLTVEKRQTATQMIHILDRLEQEYQNWKVRINIADQLICDELFKTTFQGTNRAREIHKDLSKISSSSK
jgi:hypothetical protein